MPAGEITSYIDVAQVTLYIFFAFFVGLVYYLRREDKREGYPLDSDREGVLVQGFPAMPAAKTYKLAHGGTSTLPKTKNDRRNAKVAPSAPWPGAPFVPTGNPMSDGVGPASYADRDDEPDLTHDGDPAIVPMRMLSKVTIDRRDPDPRGMEVVAADGESPGEVKDLWIDRAEALVRYLEVDLGSGRSVLLPMTMAKIDKWKNVVRVNSILAKQFSGVPKTSKSNQVTRLEEDMICGYYAGGLLYATPERAEPLL